MHLPCLLLFLLPVLAVSQPSILNFEDLQISNEENQNCGSHVFTGAPYHGFTISTPSSYGSAVFNTTSTQFCHEGSSGAGPWRKAVSKPNVFFGYGSSFTFERATPFAVKRLWFASHRRSDITNMDPYATILVSFRGMPFSGAKAVQEVRVYRPAQGDGTGPWPVKLGAGFVGLRRWTAAAEWRWVGGDGVQRAVGADTYADNIEYEV